MWIDGAFLYQIEPLGDKADILQIADWSFHIKSLGADAVITRCSPDKANEIRILCSELHKEDIKLVAGVDAGCVDAEDIKKFREYTDADGLVLENLYLEDAEKTAALRALSDKYDDFVLIGEAKDTKFNEIANDFACHYALNYEYRRSVLSAFNNGNMHQVCFCLKRFSGDGMPGLVNFSDNHRTDRIFSMLYDKNHIRPLYGLLFSVPGVPCVYYGEWDGENRVLDYPSFGAVSSFIGALADIRRESKALKFGSYREITVLPKVAVFERQYEDEKIIVAINAECVPMKVNFDSCATSAVELITGDEHTFSGAEILPEYSVSLWKIAK